MTAREPLETAATAAELHADLREANDLRERQADLLRRTAVALRGPEPPLTRWSWHDLPELAAELHKDATRLRARVLELEAVHEDASGAVLAERERCATAIRAQPNGCALADNRAYVERFRAALLDALCDTTNAIRPGAESNGLLGPLPERRCKAEALLHQLVTARADGVDVTPLLRAHDQALEYLLQLQTTEEPK